MRILFIAFLLSGCWSLVAQTMGPTQPEAAGFRAVGADNMVNLYTGNFSYNLPLMVVPGPDGGYPINLFYSGNVSMEQSASWAGLGWNLNCGAIQRNLRGLPDDFRGDVIEKEFYTKPSTTVSVDITPAILEKELVGAEWKKKPGALNQSFNLYYNNYSGLGISAGINLANDVDEESNISEGLHGSLGLSFGSEEGLSLAPKVSYSNHLFNSNKKWFRSTDHTLALGAKINSLQGFHDLNTAFSLKRLDMARGENMEKRFDNDQRLNRNIGRSTGVSFASAAPLARITTPRTTLSVSYSTEIDLTKPDIVNTKELLGINGTLTRSWITNTQKSVPAYGAMYMAHRQGADAITDFYRENEGPLTKDKVITPVPVLSYDIFSIQGHGIGGSFRAYQNSVGKLSDPAVRSNSGSGGLGSEFGSGGALKLGVSIDGSFTRSYSGPWRDKARFQQNLDKYAFSSNKTSHPLFEPFYFKMIGELQPTPLTAWADLEADDPLAFDIRMTWDVISAKVRALNSLNHGNRALNVDPFPERQPRVHSIEYYTRSELDYQVAHVIPEGSNSLGVIPYAGTTNHSLEAMSVLKPNGVRYNYFLPAYNTRTEKVTFAIPGTTTGNPKVITYVNGQAVTNYAIPNNGAGEDEFFSKEVIPQYAHTFFLTSILSQDYVDVDDNGPSDNDLGSYVKFIYDEVRDYKWRFPFTGAYYTKGYASNREDDKASYQEGEKHLYYVRAIETKTHVAVFETAASSLQDANRSKQQRELVSISLYSKSDPNYTPDFYLNASGTWPAVIQKVHFHIEDHLRRRTPNSVSAYSPALDSLHFTYYDSRRGEQAKYLFNYGENPDYADHQQDRWGSYQPDRPSENIWVNENPYTYQEENYNRRDAEAAAWLMDEIVLPSKGRITVDYEKDDYAYVQDRLAASFVQLVGSGDGSNNYNLTLDQGDEYLYFESPYPLSDRDDVKAQLEGLDYVRFRAYLDLKFSDRLLGPASDYVEGYAKVLHGNEGVVSGTNIGYFKIDRIPPKSTSTFKAHPIRLAAWQYIRRSRPDLGINFDITSNPADLIAFAARNALAMINEFANLFGYYNNARIKGWAKELDADRPSYLRLVNPVRKYGGDTRVRQITLHSNDPQNPTYGQVYEYQLPDGRSSGVAEFEPLVGLEESLFTQPVWYNANNDGQKIIFSNEQSFHEEPLGAGLYPSAQVGYSRVIVRNLPDPRITQAQSGVSVSEFFTARDFPTRFESYGAMLQEYPVKVLIPFVGMQSFNNTGYSMGYAYTLNNAIYGRPKSEATYPYTADEPKGQPVQRSVYHYQTEPANPRVLNNQVVALRKEGDKTDVLLGKEVDFYIDEIEAATWGLNAGSNFNLDYQATAFLPSWFPSIGYQESNTRYLTTNKVIYNIPILERVEQFKDGAKVTTENLFYDYETGDPIISSVTNEWEQPVYTYHFPAHWSYEQMKGAANNYRAELTLQIINPSVGVFKLNQGPVSGRIPENLLQNGDQIRFANGTENFFVTDLDRTNNRFRLTNRAGLPPSGLSNVSRAMIVRSGFRNLQATRKGQIVSLTDWSDYVPQTGLSFSAALLTNYNQYQASFNSSSINLGPQSGSAPSGTLSERMPIYPCRDLDVNVTYTLDRSTLQLDMQFGGRCGLSLSLANHRSTRDFDPAQLRFEEPLNAARPVMVYSDPRHPLYGTRFPVTINEEDNCFECQQRDPITVLYADATEFSDEWPLNYLELPDQGVANTLSQIAAGNSLGNPYAYGLQGIWRPWRTSSYLIDRKQRGNYGQNSRIDIDGEYEEFYWFDWKSPISYNEKYHWRWVNEVTQYNVNGSSKEGRNRLDIHAASLFGYQNNLVTASASNSKTTDIAFDSFEDYSLDAANNYRGAGHGNLQFIDNTSGGPMYPLYEEGHTGRYSYNLAEGQACSSCYYKYQTPLPGKGTSFEPQKEQAYSISFWTKRASVTNYNRNNDIPAAKVEVRSNGNLLLPLQVAPATNPIDGWYRVEGTFTVPAGATDFELRMYMVEDDDVLIDDLRIQLFHSGMEAYIYDPSNYRLQATLSNQNFATFYNYDEEGNLIQTKVETERGIKTISQNRSNIRH